MTVLSIPNRPAGTDQRSIEAILADFDAVIAWANGNIDTNNISPTAGIKFTQLAPGAWVALTLGTGIGASGTETPSARLEGDVVRFKGALANTSGGSIAAGSTLATMPVSMNPPKQRNLVPTVNTGSIAGSGALDVTTGGLLQNVTWSLATTGVVPLDGLSYTLT